MKGGVQSNGPQPRVIIPSAAFSGAIISFVLCPSELVKVRGYFLCSAIICSSMITVLFPSQKQGCDIVLLQCRMQVQGTDSLVPKSSSYSGPLDCALKTIKSDGVRNTLLFGNSRRT